jgi:hypothetical protein
MSERKDRQIAITHDTLIKILDMACLNRKSKPTKKKSMIRRK